MWLDVSENDLSTRQQYSGRRGGHRQIRHNHFIVATDAASCERQKQRERATGSHSAMLSAGEVGNLLLEASSLFELGEPPTRTQVGIHCRNIGVSDHWFHLRDERRGLAISGFRLLTASVHRPILFCREIARRGLFSRTS